MLYSRSNVIKDSSLITIEKDGKIIHNPSKNLLESEGWTKCSGQFSQFTNKRFIKMTSDVLEGFDKEELVDTIIFLTDTNKLYLNGQYFGGEDINISYNNYTDGVNIGQLVVGDNSYDVYAPQTEVPNVSYNDHTGGLSIGQLVVGDDSYDVYVPQTYYNSYTDGVNIGQLVVGDSSYDVYAPQTDVYYESNQENGVLLGTLYVNGVSFPIYTKKSQEVPILSQEVTIDELNSLISTNKLNPGQKYVVTDYRTTVGENIGEAVYQENEKHELIFTALNNSELDIDATSLQTFKSSSETTGDLEPTGDFELIAYKCDKNPETGEYEFDDTEVYKYKGDTIDIDGVTHYIWTKYENGVPILGWQGQWEKGKCRVVTSSLDFECSLENPYHPDYYISYDESINDQYFFEEPGPDDGAKELTDSFGRVERIDHLVYNYKVIADVCDWDSTNEVYGYDDISWYVYCGDTIDIDGVTYFIWYKTDLDTNSDVSCCFPLTDTLYLDCSIENPYTPELWMTADGELNNEYFNPTNTDIFCGIKESNLPSLVQEIEVVDREPVITKVHADLNITKNFDESQVVNALAFKTKVAGGNTPGDYHKDNVDYESMHLYSGDTFELDGKIYYVWDKWFGGFGELINGQYAIDEYNMYPQKLLTDKLYIDCSLNKPYTADYSLTQDGETTDNYQFNHYGDSFVEIKYFNNVTNYIRFVNNGWYVRCPELDRDGKFGWAFISNTVNTSDNSCDWIEGGSDFGPFPAFMNTYNLDENDFFLTDTLDPQVGDSFYRNGEEEELDTIDKVWGTIITPEISYKGIYYMKDEFGNEASYDFKHIKFNNLYTFGNEEEDYSLNGFENGVYNNVIMKPVDSNYNRMNISSKNTYGNTFYPSCRDCVIDFSIQESIITKSDRGLHPFCPTNFVEPVAVKDMLNPLKTITYTTTDEQIVNPKQDAFGNVNIITNKYE